jgi:hypothetical protein
MSSRITKVFRTTLQFAAVLAVPAASSAQQPIIAGTVTDPAGRPVASVSVTAIHVASGDKVAAATDANGSYRIPVEVGPVELLFAAPGFATVRRTGVELLIGQQGLVNIQLTPAREPTVIVVTGDVQTQTTFGSTNLDTRQTEDIPVNGRVATDLAKTAVGNTQTRQSDEPVDTGMGTFQLNYDGQRVTQNMAPGFGQAHYSRDALGQMQVVQNRFDATQGGVSGGGAVQVNAVTKSGANRPAGSFSGFFRDDAGGALLARDFVTKTVQPYSDTQIVGSFGGPLIPDKLHYFANYEYERNPHTLTYNTPYPSFNTSRLSMLTQRTGLLRVDWQLTPTTRLAVRVNDWNSDDPYDARYGGGATLTPSSNESTTRHSDDVWAILSQVLSSRALNQVNFGYSSVGWLQEPSVRWPASCGFAQCRPYPTLDTGAMIVTMSGFTVGQAHANAHERQLQWTYSVQDLFTYSYQAKGAHALKVGGAFLYMPTSVFICNKCMGQLNVNISPSAFTAQTGIDFASLFPGDSTNQALWNLAPLSKFVTSYVVGLGQMQVYSPTTLGSAWAQDDWKIGTKLTVNLGVRYDVQTGIWDENLAIQPWLQAGRPIQKNEIAPRVGFAYQATTKSTLRGGTGLFFQDPGSPSAYWTNIYNSSTQVTINNTGAPDFASNPFGTGGVLGLNQINLCTLSGAVPTGAANSCLPRNLAYAIPTNVNRAPYSEQTSIGVQQQLTKNSAFAVDFVVNLNRLNGTTVNQNVSYNPATGVNYVASGKGINYATLPVPQWSLVQAKVQNGASDYYAIQGGFTKRLANRWQAGVTYLWVKQFVYSAPPINPLNPITGQNDCTSEMTYAPATGFSCTTPIAISPAIADGTWYLDTGQRQKITANAIWQLPHGFQLSGVYLYGDQGWATPAPSTDLYLSGAGAARVQAPFAGVPGFSCTLAAETVVGGCLIPRNLIKLPSIKKLDVRVAKTIAVGTRVRLQGIAEVFNVLNTVNYDPTKWVTSLGNLATYTTPGASSNIQYYPRMAQFAFRATF